MARETVRIEGLDTVLRRLKALGPAASKRGGPVRAAVRKAGNVIKKQMVANIERIVAEPNVGGDDESTGLMAKSVKVVRAKAPKKYKGETAFVLIPKRIRYPIGTKTPSGIGVARVGQILEYHTSVKNPGTKWARPAFHAKKEEAAQTMATEVEKGIAKLEKTVAASVR